MRSLAGRVATATALALTLGSCTGASPDETAGPRVLAPDDAPLAPGPYATQDFSRPFSFTVDRPTWVAVQEEPDIVTLSAGGTELVFATPRLVYEKREGLVPRPAPLPRDLVEWLVRRPDLAVRGRTRATVGGEPAVQVDVEVRELYEEAELLGCPLPCFPIAPGGRGAEPLFLTHTHRVLVLEGARPLVVVYGTGERDGERAARALLASVRFRPLSAP